MKKTGVLFALLASVAVVGFALSRQETMRRGDKAPAFAGAAANGQNLTLSGLLAKGPVVLYFIKEDCPVNAEAIRYYNRLATGYGGKSRLVGVINADKKGYAAWARRFKPTFPVMLDPSLKVIRGYKAQASPWTVEVARDGKVANVWPGYSTKELKEINGRLALAAGAPVAKVDLSGAPSGSAFG